MLPALSEQLTAQFYDWEQRGRGWHAYTLPVQLEPPFHPFFFHSTPAITYVDDGKRHTLFSWVASLFKPTANKTLNEADDDEEQFMPFLLEQDEDLKSYTVSLPKGYKVDVEVTEQLLLMISYCKYPVSFEIIGSPSVITLQFVCRTSDAPLVASQVKAYFPECIIQENDDLIDELVTNGDFASIVEYGLKNEFMCPLAMVERFDPDPFIGLFAAMEHLKSGEHAVIQVLFQGAINPWAESIMRSVTGNDGKPFFADAPEMVSFAKEKVSAPLFGVAMRVMGAAGTVERAHEILSLVGSAFGRLYFSKSNSLIPLGADIDFETRVANILLRRSNRLGMLLNSKELATIVHFPSDSVASSKLIRDGRKTKAAPAVTEGHKLILGTNEHEGISKKVGVSSTQRLKHTHIIGATGTGKSTLLLSLIVQDIQNGEGITVLDPHGDLIESILQYIPEDRVNDVIIIDPADADFPVGFNILSAHSEIEKDILSSDLVAVFKRLSTSWGDQMNSVFANAILAFLESSQGGTLVDLRRFLVEKSFRDSYLKTVTDPSVVYYWQKEFPLLKSGSIGPILTRLDAFLRPKLIRNMVAQKKGLDFEQIMDSKKILLVKLSQGLIGNENSYLLGTFFVTKIYQAAMARQIKTKEKRSDFFLYIDEFQNFITPSMSQILSGARKYHLGLILVHQDMQQLVKYDSELASSVVSNAGTRVCFRLGDTDAKRFANGFSFFEPQDLENLNTGQAIARLERPEYDFSLTTTPLPVIEKNVAEKRVLSAIDHSRKIYGTAKADIEAMLDERMASIQEVQQPQEQYNQMQTPPPTTIQLPKEIPEERLVEVKEQLIKQKEETEHRYLQMYIKRMAEARGYKVTLEELTPDGKGRIDVALLRNNKKIACEICVTTEVDWEIHNIQKCLDADFDIVVECSNSKSVLEQIQKKIGSVINMDIRSKILFLEPDGFIQYLDDEVAKEASSETRVKGYRVNVKYTSVGQSEMEDKKASIRKAVINSLKDKKP